MRRGRPASEHKPFLCHSRVEQTSKLIACGVLSYPDVMSHDLTRHGPLQAARMGLIQRHLAVFPFWHSACILISVFWMESRLHCSLASLFKKKRTTLEKAFRKGSARCGCDHVRSVKRSLESCGCATRSVASADGSGESASLPEYRGERRNDYGKNNRVLCP